MDPEEILKRLQEQIRRQRGWSAQALAGAGEVLPTAALGAGRIADWVTPGGDPLDGSLDWLENLLTTRREESAPEDPGEGSARFLGRGLGEAALGGPRAAGQVALGTIVSAAGKEESSLAGVSSLAEWAERGLGVPGAGAVAEITDRLAENPVTRMLGEAGLNLLFERLIPNRKPIPNEKPDDDPIRNIDKALENKNLPEEARLSLQIERARLEAQNKPPLTEEDMLTFDEDDSWWSRVKYAFTDGAEFRTRWVDNKHPLIYSAREGGAPISDVKDLDWISRTTTGADAISGRWLLTGVDEVGTTNYKPMSRGLLEIIRDQPDLRRTEHVLTGIRAKVLRDRGERIPDIIKEKMGKWLDEARRMPEVYGPAAVDVQKFTDAHIEVMDRAGLIDDVDALREANPFYFPFHHVDRSRNVREGGIVGDPINKYVGSELPMRSPFEALARQNRYVAGIVTRKGLLDMFDILAREGKLKGVRGVAELPKSAVKYVRGTEEAGKLGLIAGEVAPDELAKHIKNNPDDLLYTTVGGKRYIKRSDGGAWEVSEQLWDAMSGLSPDEMKYATRLLGGDGGILSKLTQSTASGLRFGVVTDLFFMVRNVLKDGFTRTLNSESLARGVPHPFRGLVALDQATEQWIDAYTDLVVDSFSHTKIGKKLGVLERTGPFRVSRRPAKLRKSVAEFELSGGAHGNIMGLDHNRMVRTIHTIQARKGSRSAAAARALHYLWDGWRLLGSHAETASKLAEYKSARSMFDEAARVADDAPISGLLPPDPRAGALGRGGSNIDPETMAAIGRNGIDVDKSAAEEILSILQLGPGETPNLPVKAGSNLPAVRGMDVEPRPSLGLDPEIEEYLFGEWEAQPRPMGTTHGTGVGTMINGKLIPTDSVRAGGMAADVTTDFRRKGQEWVDGMGRMLMAGDAFFGPRIQGLDRTARMIYDPRTGKVNKEAFARLVEVGVPILTIPALAMYKANRENEDWRNLTDYEKALSIHIPLGDIPTPAHLTTEDATEENILKPLRRQGNTVFFRAPIPWDVGWLLATGPVQMLWARDPLNPRNKTSADMAVDAAWQEAVRMFGDLIPMTTLGRAAFQLAQNKDWFRDVPVDPPYEKLEGLSPELRGLDSATEAGKFASRNIAEVMPEGMTPSGPQADFLARGLGGGMGRAALEALSFAVTPDEQEVQVMWNEYTGLKSMFTDSRALGQAGDDFYQELFDTGKKVKDFKQAVKHNLIDLAGRKIPTKYEVDRFETLSDINDEIKSYRKMMENIPDEYSPEQHRAIEDVIRDQILWRVKVGSFNRRARTQLLDTYPEAQDWVDQLNAIDEKYEVDN